MNIKVPTFIYSAPGIYTITGGIYTITGGDIPNCVEICLGSEEFGPNSTWHLIAFAMEVNRVNLKAGAWRLVIRKISNDEVSDLTVLSPYIVGSDVFLEVEEHFSLDRSELEEANLALKIIAERRWKTLVRLVLRSNIESLSYLTYGNLQKMYSIEYITELEILKLKLRILGNSSTEIARLSLSLIDTLESSELKTKNIEYKDIIHTASSALAI